MATPPDPLSDSLPSDLSRADCQDVAKLLERARAGDQGALGILLEGQRERLQRIVRVHLGKPLRRFLNTSDVVQETHRAALEALQGLSFTSERDLLAWLARVATNRIRDQHDHYTAHKRDATRDQPLAEAAGPLETGQNREPSPSQAAAQAELSEIVDHCLSELPDEYREVIVLRDYCGASWEHITAELGGRSLHATQQLHQRAWIKLRKRVLPLLDGA